MNQDSPARRWAEHYYDATQREWHEELSADPPDWSRLDDLEQQLLALETYLARLDLGEWL